MASIMGIDNICRLCAVETRSGVIIYSKEGENLCLEKKIINCLRLEISRNDMLPKQVCQSCSLLLQDYHKFCEKAIQVQQTLFFILGLHLQHSSKSDSESGLINNGIKVESNAIKRESEEIISHQANVQVSKEKFLANSKNNLSKKQEFCHDIIDPIKKLNNTEDYDDSKNFIINNYDMGKNVIKQHCNSVLNEKRFLDKKLVNNQLISNIIGENKSNLEYLKNNQNNVLLQDLNNGSNNKHLVINEESTNEESKIMEAEWEKDWGIMCDLCKSILQDRSQFERHYQVLHNKNPVYTCSYCKKSLDKHISYRLHIFQHINSGKFKCIFCNKKFFNERVLQIHFSYFHSKAELYTCKECGSSFDSMSKLIKHQKIHSSKSQAKLKEENYKCDECGKILQTRGGLAAHKSAHKFGRHFMCHICGKIFTQKINMQQHVKNHEGEKPHSCDICEKRFSEKSHLNRHKSFHTRDRPFQCLICKKRYKTSRCLKVHSRIHSNSRPYVCSLCGKGFLSSTKLKQHHNCHTGERPFACKYCERRFTNYPNWLKHNRRRHKTGLKSEIILKEEQAQSELTVEKVHQHTSQIPAIELIEKTDVEIKQDERDSAQSQYSVLNTISPFNFESTKFQTASKNIYFGINSVPQNFSSSLDCDHVLFEEHTFLS